VRWDEGKVRELAAEHHGVVNRDSVIRAGGTDEAIQTRVDRGSWRQLHPGVYYLNVTAPTWAVRLYAAVLAGGPGAVASHRAAGMMWDLEGFQSRALEVTVPYSYRPEPAGTIVHRTRRPLPREHLESIPVTTVERTVLDLAAILPGPALEKAVQSAIRRELTTIDRLAAIVSEQGGRGVRGSKKLRRAIVDADYDKTGSPAEVDMIQLIRKAPIPQPISQYEVDLPSGDHAYPDFAWPDRSKFVEVDGFGAHGTPVAFERDLIRQNMLLELGWEMRRYSAALIRRDPSGVIRDLQRFIEG
jgi:hypothetical protein